MRAISPNDDRLRSCRRQFHRLRSEASTVSRTAQGTVPDAEAPAILEEHGRRTQTPALRARHRWRRRTRSFGGMPRGRAGPPPHCRFMAHGELPTARPPLECVGARAGVACDICHTHGLNMAKQLRPSTHHSKASDRTTNGRVERVPCPKGEAGALCRTISKNCEEPIVPRFCPP
jgi:hypothetical protein